MASAARAVPPRHTMPTRRTLGGAADSPAGPGARRAAAAPSAASDAEGCVAARRSSSASRNRNRSRSSRARANPARAAHGQVSAEGRFPDLLLLAERLGKDPAGFVLARVSLARSRDGARLEAEGFTLREGW